MRSAARNDEPRPARSSRGEAAGGARAGLGDAVGNEPQPVLHQLQRDAGQEYTGEETEYLRGIQRRQRFTRKHHLPLEEILVVACEVGYDADADEVRKAVEKFRRDHGKQFVTFVEVLRVIKSVGYRRVVE